MNLLEMYCAVSGVLDKIDFARLFPGFHRYGCAVYDNEMICLNGELMPYDPGFMGNTSLLYHGEYIAIWNVGADPVADIELLASSLVHEMFHCHQNTLGETRFPSDLTLLNYPADSENYVRKFRENQFLADACEKTDLQALSCFAAIRNLRHEQYPDMVREEWKTETLEGMAEFIALKALAQIHAGKFREKVQDYLGLIREESPLQFDIRRISYYTGAILFLCLERLGVEVRNEIGSSLTVYEQNPIAPVEKVEILPCPSLETVCAGMRSERRREIEAHIAVTDYTECDAEICGYDPMNMFRVDNRILCRHLVFLRVNGEVRQFFRRIVLVLRDGSDRAVKGYY